MNGQSKDGQSSFEVDVRLIRSVVYANNVLQRLSTRLVYGPAGLTHPQYLLLLLLREAKEPVGLTELANRAHVIKQAMTSASQRLQAKGLVAEVRDPADRRVSRIGLTAEGEALLAKLEPARRGLYAEWLDRLPVEARARAAELLGRVVDAEADIIQKRQTKSSSTNSGRKTAQGVTP